MEGYSLVPFGFVAVLLVVSLLGAMYGQSQPKRLAGVFVFACAFGALIVLFAWPMFGRHSMALNLFFAFWVWIFPSGFVGTIGAFLVAASEEQAKKERATQPSPTLPHYRR